MNEKNKSQIEIIKIVQDLKRKSKKIVTLSGSFDILHRGHIRILREAKKQGDVLIVLLNSDRSIRSYKGLGRPINSQKDRAEVLAALDFIDFITIFGETTPKKILEKIKPDIYCQSRDWGKNCIEREIVEKNGGKTHILKWAKGVSTTKLIKKVLASYSKPEAKAVFLNLPEYLLVVPVLEKLSESNYKIITLTNKSRINLLKKSAREFGLNLSKSWLISNNERDVIIGREANIKTIKIGKKMSKKLKLEPNYYTKDLLETVKIILSS